MTDLIALAKECGAHVGTKETLEHGVEPYIFITGANLAAFADRIRKEEREKVLRVMKSRYDHEVAAAAHHADKWYVAYEYHMKRQAAMSDLMEAVRASFSEHAERRE
jgi:hypothetical protein